MDQRSPIADAWQQAARDLHIAVRELGPSVLVEGFGSAHGMLCQLIDGEGNRSLQEAARARGTVCSALGEVYREYDRDLFIATLDDWGWHGTGSPPAWYSGVPWTE